MKTYRFAMLSLVVISLIFLCGFKKPNKKHRLVKQKPTITEQQEAKPLNLAIPASSSATLLAGGEEEIYAPSQSAEMSAAEIFNSARSSNKPLDLKGQIIMSQEPEAEKSKSADGAGIMINIHH